MTVMSVGLFVLGLAMLVYGLMTASKARAAWMARSIAGTAKVLACAPVVNPETLRLEAFTISVEYSDTGGQPHTAELPASQQFQTGDPIDIRYDPQHPATVYLSEHFQRTDLPVALIAFGGALMLVSFAYVKD